MNKNIWIAVSGIDGSGKTSICKFIRRLLNNSTFIKFPHFDWVRRMLKISGKNTPYKDKYTDSLIFATSNNIDMYIIEDVMKKHKFVISQRFWLDNFPYRLVQNISIEETKKLMKPERLKSPNIIFFLNCNSKEAYRRIKNSKGDKYETKEFMEKLDVYFKRIFRNTYKKIKLKNLKNTIIIEIDSDKPLKEVKKEIKNQLTKLKIIK